MKMKELKKKAEMMDMSEMMASKKGYEMEGKSEEECIEEAMETLIEAEKIKQDVELMAKIQKELRKQSKAISSIQDIKDRYVEVTIKSTPEDILDPETGKVSVKSVKDDGEDDVD